MCSRSMEKVENSPENNSKDSDDDTSLVPVPRLALKAPPQTPSSLLECMPSGVPSVMFQGQPVIVLNLNNSLDSRFNFPTFTLGQPSSSFCEEQMKILHGGVQHLPMLTNSAAKQTKGTLPLQLPMIMPAEQCDTEPKIVPIADDEMCMDTDVAGVLETGVVDMQQEPAHSNTSQQASKEMSVCGEKSTETICSPQLNEPMLIEDSQDLPSCCSSPLLLSPVRTSVGPNSRQPSSPDGDLNNTAVTPDRSDHCAHTAPAVPVGGTVSNGLGLLTQEVKEVIRMEDSDDELDLPETNESDVQLFPPAAVDSQNCVSSSDGQHQVCTQVSEECRPLAFSPTSQTASCSSSIPNGQGSESIKDIPSVPSHISESGQGEGDSIANPASHPGCPDVTVPSVKTGNDDIPARSFRLEETTPSGELQSFSAFTVHSFQSTSLPASSLQANAQVDQVPASTAVSVVPVPNSDVPTEDCSVVPIVSSESIPKTHLPLSYLQHSSAHKQESSSCTSSCDGSSVKVATELQCTTHQSDSQDSSLAQTVPGDTKPYMSSDVLVPTSGDFSTSPLLPLVPCSSSSSISSTGISNLKRQASHVNNLSVPLPKKPLKSDICMQQDQALFNDPTYKNDKEAEKYGDSTFCEEDDVLLEPLSPESEYQCEPLDDADDGCKTLNAALPSSARLSNSQQFDSCHDSDGDDPSDGDDDDDSKFGTRTAGISTEPTQPTDTVSNHCCSFEVPTNEAEEGSGDLNLYPEIPKVVNKELPASSSISSDGITRRNSKVQEFPCRPLYSFPSSTNHFSTSGVCPTAPVKPRLRMGLSRRQKVQPLHQQSIYRRT